MICVIGSHAINRQLYALKGFKYRKPVDLDIVGDYDEVVEFAKGNLKEITEQYLFANGSKLIFKAKDSVIPFSNIMEAEITWDGSTAKMLHDLILTDPETIYADGLAYASLGVCYMLKMSDSKRGKNLSEDTKTKISFSLKDKPKEKIICPHCGKEGGVPAMKQWHFDNCKYKED